MKNIVLAIVFMREKNDVSVYNNILVWYQLSIFEVIHFEECLKH